MLGNQFILKTLGDIGCIEDIPETQPTISGNASQKANYIFEKYHTNCFADDTGLEIEALNGEPGVLSARYAGNAKNSDANIAKVLKNLNDKTNRNARFKTVISLVINKKEFLFEGIINGKITGEKIGINGFGYDSIFIPDGYSITFAQMSDAEKNAISHRGIAFQKLIEHLTTVVQ